MDARTPQQRILARKTALWQDRQAWDTHCQDIADFLLPRAARFDESQRNRNDAQAYNSIIDETGTLAHGILSAGLMGGMTSPARPWMRLATPDRDLMEHATIKQWLRRLTDLMLAIFASSNSYRALHSIYEQQGAFGVGASIVVDNFQNVLHHFPQVFGRYAIGLDQWGMADTIYREIEKTVSQLVEEFGKANCSNTVQRLFDQGKYDTGVKVLHAIEPRRDRDVRKRDARNMRFASRYIELGRDNDTPFLRESGFKEFPAIAARWIVDGDDTYAARWPGAVALGSIKQLQQEQLQKSTAIDYQVDPPLQVPVAYKNQDIDRLPGGTMYVDATGPGSGVRSAYEVNLNLQHLLGSIQDVRQRINQSFFVPLFQMLANDQRSGITAREIVERHEEKLLMLGPVIERQHNELLKPFIDITFAKIVRAGLLVGNLAPPRELQGQDLEVEFVSTLAQAQRAVGVQSIDRLIGTIGSLSQIWPGAADKLDADQAVDAYADMLGVDPSLIVADDRVAIIRKDRQALQQAQQLAAAAGPMKDMALAAKAAGEAGAASQFSGYSIPGIMQ
jgi:Bacteriophage head to tail connecting protein